jgi:hypothetical protein
MPSPPRLRGYVVERWLGAGGSSDVWQARASASGARVALKRISVQDDEGRARAHAEGALLSALDHPNLVRLHDLIEVDDAVVLVLDLAEAGSLADLLAARIRLTPGEVITAIAPVAAALAHLHEAGVVHGDVSAANILFTVGGVPMLADVGVARLTGDARDAEATPAYVDPEVAAGGVPTAPSDVFMLGGVALHALTGRAPWPAEGPPAAAWSVAAVADRLAAANESMAASVVRALAPDPQRRGTAADLALDLAHSVPAVAVDFAAGRVPAGPAGEWTGPRHAAVPPGDPPPTRLVARPRPVIPRPPPRGRRRVPVLVAIAAAGLLGCAGVAWAGIDSGGPGRPPVATSQLRPQVEANTPTVVVPSEAVPPDRSVDRLDWLAELHRLDALRSRAFANRRPSLLRRVYWPGRLLQADLASLARLVPPGCRLTGAHTRYRRVDVASGEQRAVVTAAATMAASRLICPGRATRHAPAAAARLRIVLTRSAGAVRIATERTLD